MMPVSGQKKPYEQDFVAWLDDTVVKLKQKRFDEIDTDSLIQEIEGLANRDRRELKKPSGSLAASLTQKAVCRSARQLSRLGADYARTAPTAS